MTIEELILSEGIKFPESDFISYGHDQVFVTVPRVFPTVLIELENTPLLSLIADLIRIKENKNLIPIGIMTGGWEMDWDMEAYYQFFIGLNRFDGADHTDSCLQFIVQNSHQEDNEELYYIDLSDEVTIFLWNLLNKKLLVKTGHDATWHLDEAERRINENGD